MDFPSKFGRNASESTGFLFMRAYNHWHTRVKQALQGIDLTHPQFVVLTAVGYLSQSSEEVFQVTIANFSDMDVMTVSQVLKLLEKKALIWRTVAKNDPRAKAISLTHAGQAKLEIALPIVENIDTVFFSNVSELKQFQHALQELTKEDD
ncbi:MarR family winged helix-turn-helix transcriptional regulator [Listeria riparia]|uniref:MarR family transcriptional regulator n=1 Tax=Listeria riparia FSL S10-1204 TaxID=1265816 RepID=W7DAY7_9LIST|nr:MarR family winged helix-turn-helix transcriptional regulator [Listeria riparia]EUJ46245.1 MarR family transcriptional regulator [Listeria riparia FSL S10-1204]